MQAFGLERCGNATQSLGLAQAALDQAIAYTQERKAFGKPIVDFQGVQLKLAEMAMRVEVLLRRREQAEAVVLRGGGIECDLVRRTVKVDGEPVRLLHMEFRLLEFLMRNQGEVMTRRIIFERVWGYYFDPGANLISVHIARLRKKIDRPDRSSPIQTVKGEGYLFDGG